MSVDDGSSVREFTREKSGIRFGSEQGVAQVNPSSIVAKIEATGGEAATYDDELPALKLPGHGELNDDCGDDVPRFCADCGHVTHVGSTCYRWSCPRCWKGADRRRAATITAKLEALRRYKESSGPGWQGWKFHHLVLSPPEGFGLNSGEPLDRTIDLLKEILDELTATTGVLFYHPYRGEDGDDRGFWKHVLPDGDVTDWQDTMEQLTYSPHFHAVVLAKHVPGSNVTKTVEEQTGWVINRITKGGDSDVSIYDRYDLARVVTYCLSHTGVEMGDRTTSTYRYYGEVANFAAEEHVEREMDAAVRSVAVKTLGLPYDSLTCVVEREGTETATIEVDAEKVNLGAAHGSGSGAGAGTEEKEVEIEREEPEACEGRLLEIGKAPAFLEDDDWLASAEHAEQLQTTWEKWREEVDAEPG